MLFFICDDVHNRWNIVENAGIIGHIAHMEKFVEI